MENNTTGSSNCSFGNSALQSATTSSSNNAFGVSALSSNTTGSSNNAFGYLAANLNTTGNANIAIGNEALRQNTTGSNNTAVGLVAGNANITGSNLTFIGFGANPTTNNLINATAIGYQATVDASNKVRIGNASISVIEGQVAWSNPSDRRLKENIVYSNRLGLDFINHLNTVSYNYIADKNKVRYDGFIAQDIDQAMKEKDVPFSGLKKSEDGMYSLAYSDFVMPLVNAVKELSAKIERMEAISTLQQKLITELQAKIEGSENKKQEEHSQK